MSARDLSRPAEKATPDGAATDPLFERQLAEAQADPEWRAKWAPTPGTTLTLPWPPSLNALFSDGRKRRTISKRYELWIAEANVSLLVQKPRKLTGPVRATLMLSPPDNRERDADNYAKAPMDLLVKAGVIEADSRRCVRSILLAWSDAQPAKPGCVTVHLVAA